MSPPSETISPINIIEAQKAIEEIELGLKNNDSLINKMFVSKRDTVRYLAECYEVLANSNTIELEKSNIANFLMKRLQTLNVNIGTSWVYESLPWKYKLHKQIKTNETDSGEWNQNSSQEVDYETENKLEISFLTEYIKLLKDRKIALKNERFFSKLEPEEYNEHYLIKMNALAMAENAWNNRKTVPLNTIHLLLQAFDTFNLKYAAGHYISLLKKFGSEKKDHAIKQLETTFSDKQLRKILKGQTRELHMSMEIHTQEEAYENGFYGKKQCGECSSWRIILTSQYEPATQHFSKLTTLCFACGNIDVPPTVQLPLSVPTPRITEEKVL